MGSSSVAGDGTTTSIVLANGMIQLGAGLIEKGAKAVERCKGITIAVEAANVALRAAATPVTDHSTLSAVARISASGSDLGDLVAEAFRRVGREGVISTDYGLGAKTELVVVDGMSFDRGHISHHMVTDTVIIRGEGDVATIAARRAQVQRLYENAPPNIDKDKLQERLAKLCGGTATILAGGVTPVEQKRTIQLIEDALNAVRAAADEGVIAGSGVGLAGVAPTLDLLAEKVSGDMRKGIKLVQSVLTLPLARIAFNSGAEPNEVVGRVCELTGNQGYNAATGVYQDLMQAGVIDPIRVTCAALANAGSVATLILTTKTLIADPREDEDPTAARALGGGAELLGRK